MNNKTTAVFYDGNSSVPQQIEISLNKLNASLEFKLADGTNCKWSIKDIDFDKRAAQLHLKHGVDTVQHIKIKDVHFITIIDQYRKENGHIGWYQRLLDLGTAAYFGIAIVVIAIIGLSYVYAIPWVAEKSVVLIPEEYDDTLGDSAWAGNMNFITIDSTKTKVLNDFAKQLNLQNTKPLKFTVVESNEVNAFALPNGEIVVFTGILKEMKNYDELVGLLGHEASHVNNRHSMKMLCRSLSGYLFVSVILGDVNGIMATIGDNVNSFQSLSFSREFEHQADLEGFKILVANKVDPQGMSNLFKRLKQQHFVSIPEFLSSHPVTENRIDFINQMIKTQKFEKQRNSQLEKLFAELKQ
ncbi:MAG TPA: M48 family metallopeptidase [Flavobacterium sp.]|nr:M48 family metallopeptidase [Flavobacterium sp.]